MTLESRIERLERARPAARRVHVIFVPDCVLDDEAHNQAADRRALEANPLPEGAELVVVQFVAPKPANR
jgi:hypothetical protein